MSGYIETPAEIYKRNLQRLERAASEVSRLGAVTGPQWVKLSDTIPQARVALLTVPAPPAQAWLPIETAPKDGTVIDVWRDGIRETVYWGFPPHECGEMGQYCDSDRLRLRLEGLRYAVRVPDSLAGWQRLRRMARVLFLAEAKGGSMTTTESALRDALEKCRDQFQFYATEHKAKSDAAYKVWDDACYWGNVDEQNAAHKEYHKRLTQVQTNEAMVVMIDQALATPSGRAQGDALSGLRAAGWRVAVHNDYRLNGEDHTFWLLTHPDGRWIKGEGPTDAEALAECIAAAPPAQDQGEGNA